MRFGPTPLRDAEDAILAHGFRLPGRVLKKGQRLSADDVTALREAGYDQVVTARLDPDDVAENDAARELAEALAAGAAGGAGDGPAPGTGLVTGTAFTGRCNLLAAVRGVLTVDEEGVAAVNAVGEELTLATLPAMTVVDPRRLAATVKVIPFAVRRSAPRCMPGTSSGHAEGSFGWRSSARDVPGSSSPCCPVRGRRCWTRPPRFSGTSSPASARASRPSAAARTRRARWRPPSPASSPPAATSWSSSARPRSWTAATWCPPPSRRRAGTVLRLGLPVDPGNLCLYARIGSVPVIGLPGSSRSPAASGADLLLRRVGADLSLSGREFADWGAGGLLKEQLGRPSPRSAPADAAAVSAPSPRREVAVVVLAAGQSRRMGRRNKLLEAVDGEPMVRHAVRAAASAAGGRRWWW